MRPVSGPAAASITLSARSPDRAGENPERYSHDHIIDWILDLFRNEDAARAFVAAPEQTLRDAGLAGVSAAQLSAVAATAVPGLVLGGGDPIVGLQRAVSNQYGFAPAYDCSTYAASPSRRRRRSPRRPIWRATTTPTC